MFPGGIERDERHEMGSIKDYTDEDFCKVIYLVL